MYVREDMMLNVIVEGCDESLRANCLLDN